MPRSTISYGSGGEIIESQTVKGKYKIYIHQLDQSTVSLNDKDKYLYRIGNHDQLSITVWGHPEFSSPSGYAQMAGQRSSTNGTLTTQVNQTLTPSNTGEKAFAYDTSGGVYTVDEDGDIVLPLCGPIKVVGKTTKDVKKMVAEKLVEYVVNPQVTVAMASYRSKYTFVIGEVNQSNIVALSDIPLDLASALTMSGWVNLSTADIKNIYVLRQGSGTDISVYRLDATTPTAIVFASEFVLQPSDVVFVSTAGIAQFDRVVTHFLTTAEILWYTRTAINPTTNLIPGL